MAIKIAIANYHTRLLNELENVISDKFDYQIVHHVNTLEDCYKAVQKKPVDLVVIYFNDVDTNLKYLRKLKEGQSVNKVIAITNVLDSNFLIQLISNNADAILNEKSSSTSIGLALDKVSANLYCFDDDILKNVIDTFIHKAKNVENRNSRFTQRELQVLDHICQGYTNIEIGEKLFLSPRTIEGYRQKMLEKSGMNNTATLVAYAIKHQLVMIN